MPEFPYPNFSNNLPPDKQTFTDNAGVYDNTEGEFNWQVGKVYWEVNGYPCITEDPDGNLANYLSEMQNEGKLNYPSFPHETFSPVE